jgi:hypothetical protein
MELREVFDAVTGYVNRRFYQKREHLFESSGAVSKLMPILLNSDGVVDPSMLDLSDYALLDGGNTFTGDQVLGNLRVRGDSTNSTFTSPGQIAVKRANDNPFVSFHTNAGALRAFIEAGDTSTFSVWNVLNGALRFATNNIQRAVISAGGLLGVNVSTPDAQLDVLSGAASRVSLKVDTAASPSVAAAEFFHNGIPHISVMAAGARFAVFDTAAFDNGASIGNRLLLERNSNSTTPAAGLLALRNLGNTLYRIWPDASGNLRIHTANPTNANDTAGVVVGTQTSSAAAKDIDDELPDWRQSIDHITAAVQAGALRSWRYKSGAYNGEHYPIGIVTDYAERYGQDKNRSLNIPVAIGDLMGAVATLAERVEQLEKNLNG